MSAMVDREARERIQALEELAARRDRETAELSVRLSRGEAAFARIAATVEAIRASRPPSFAGASPQPSCSCALGTLRFRDETAKCPFALQLRFPDCRGLSGVPYKGLPDEVVVHQPDAARNFRRVPREALCAAVARQPRSLPRAPLSRPLRRPRAHPDTDPGHGGGDISGGFTPVEWDSRTEEPYCKADPSLKSFLFTLKNPHNFPAMKFTLKTEEKDRAINCDSPWGPIFGDDLGVYDDCTANAVSGSSLGRLYANDPGLDGRTVLTGSRHFAVKEIKVFEITH
jgi:hypothetical protein